LAGALAVAVTGCNKVNGQGPALNEAETPVRVSAVGASDQAAFIEAPGTLAPREELQLGFKIGGVVARVAVREGDRVHAGQVLAALELTEIDAQVTRAQSALTKAERDLARARSLYADSVATLEQVQNAATALEVARSDYETARFNRRYAVIVAPAAGTVLRRSAEPGELVGASQKVLTLGNEAAGLIVRAGLADRDAVRVRTGDAAEVIFDAFPGQVFAGRVRQIGAAANLQTGTYTVEIALANAPRALAGLIGRARIQPSTRERTALVPIDAITEADGDHAIVYALAGDGKVQRLAVRIGAINGDRVNVLSGLEGVARIVTAGAAYLSDGAKVRIVP
jgi:RND family efflux transporter MFP subunit